VRDELVRQLDTSFAIGAGAGSGKTRVLVHRIVALVDAGHSIERIVAITFTDKAAAELRERVRSELARADGKLPEEVRAFRRTALAEVELAQLTTIHGFCRTILNTHPLEAGVTPGFRVLDNLESDLLVEATTAETIERVRGSADPSLESALLWGGKLSQLRELVDAIGRFPDLRPEEPPAHGESITAVVDAVVATASRIAEHVGAVDPADKLLQQALSALQRIAELLDSDAEPHDMAILLKQLSIHSNAGSRDRWAGAPEAFAVLKPEWKALRIRRDEAVAAYEDIQLAWLLEQARRAQAGYVRAKIELGALDFDDLLIKTEGLLRADPTVANRIRASFDFLLVDEFQDTDPIQARIVQELSRPVDEEGNSGVPVPAPGRLFLVGDANQSIYRFRRADLTVFESARARLLERGESARLEVNFRSIPRLVALANRVFPALLEPGGYEDLLAHRMEAPEGPAVSLVDLDPFLGPAGTEEGKKPKADQMRSAEAAALAGWIRERMASGWQIVDRRSGKPRTLMYADVAILLPVYSGLRRYEEVLERCGIPYRLSGGRTFFARVEVQQTLSVLRALADPDDEVAVVAALRSPYFGVSDESLVRWAAGGRPFTYRDDPGTGEPAPLELPLERGADEPLLEGRAMLARLHRESTWRSPSGVVRRLYDCTRALPLHALKPDGERRMANLLKLLDLASGYEDAAAALMERRGADQGGLAGLVRYLDQQRQAAAEEESALVDEDGDAVTIMTIHSAKGLEFPIVALLDRAYAARFRDRAIPNRSEHTATVQGCGLKPSNWEDKKSIEQAAQAEEERRLLYVAFTRARDHVVVCGQRSGDASEGTFLAPLESALLRTMAEDGIDAGDPAVNWVSPAALKEREPGSHRLPYALDVPTQPEIEKAVGVREAIREAWDEVVTVAGRSRVRAASALGSHEADDYGYTADERVLALIRGSRVHEAMEHAISTGRAPVEAVRWVMRPGDPAEAAEQAGPLVSMGVSVLDHCRQEGWEVAATEWPVLLGEERAIGGLTHDAGFEVVSGVADLILRHSDGRLMVVDYKTDPAAAALLLERYARQIAAYRSAIMMATGMATSAEIWALESGERIPIP
jgi:ATP-dependent exoDNAse (exonuclease V) beta subunit